MNQSHSNRTDERPVHSREIVGRFLVLFGIGLLLLYFFSTRPQLRVPLPDFWYRSGSLWPFLGAILSATGFMLQRETETEQERWNPSLPGQRFRRLIVYTREDCHLCDVAKDTLHRYAAWLPPIEEFDIDEDPELAQQYGTEIPVVSFDGTERFRGYVNEPLLRRLIEGTAPVSREGSMLSDLTRS